MEITLGLSRESNNALYLSKPILMRVGYANIICIIHRSRGMEIKEILTPKNMLIALGTIVIAMSLWGMTHGDEWAEFGWGEDNVLAHDEAYEEMWALHLMPLGVMAIVTALVVTGKELAKVAMLSPLVLVNMIGGMLILTNDNGYGGTPTGVSAALAGLMMLGTVLTCVSGFMHKDGESEAESVE